MEAPHGSTECLPTAQTVPIKLGDSDALKIIHFIVDRGWRASFASGAGIGSNAGNTRLAGVISGGPSRRLAMRPHISYGSMGTLHSQSASHAEVYAPPTSYAPLCARVAFQQMGKLRAEPSIKLEVDKAREGNITCKSLWK